MRSRLLQLLALFIVFVIGVVVFKSCHSTPAEDDTGEYIPPQP